ncbi:hypothetical protein H721_02373 [Brucella ovis IntaBari-2006-46-332]|nr:hypothetical protein C010_02539 [Brucella ovis 80/125]ENR06629.1 hypothetical protein C961_02249 [Brucella ovis F8/05B]ENS93261.1 hypothetical protein B999_02515 [Brucella ovis 63/96]ENS97726.1 hypothetical protein C009_02388 [Brucella ovis 81/8]ENT76061.1 hypothetical protein H712_02518 [Brucella ovis IntaBari-2009-88-4]ENT78304.1 hypothetical protein H720_02309 [Brucella ovis IntaBari-2006-46-348]ENT81853.1 hypothetical protein H713_02521 [Brucella ovis IntaBari-2010-47-268]ENT86445.1 h
MNQVLTETRPIRLKGRSFLAMVLSPELPLDGWLERLDDLARRSSGFFLGRPVVLDMENLAIERAQLVYLLQALNDRGVWIMGVEGARPSLLGPGMPPAMRGGQPAADFEAPAGEPQANPGAPDRRFRKPCVRQAMPCTPCLRWLSPSQSVPASRSISRKGMSQLSVRLLRVRKWSQAVRSIFTARCAGGDGGEYECANFLSQARSGIGCHRWSLQDRRGSGAEVPRTGRPALARRRLHDD